MPLTLDRVLAEHCAPVLIGEKPGALFSSAASYRQILPYSERLRPAGIEIRVMAENNSRTVFFVYRPERLSRALREEAVAETLARLGYAPDGALDIKLQILSEKIQGGDEFPHEIGFFLGYPAEDVIGFIRHKGRGYKLCGTWKVYGDVEAAKRAFAEYKACRQRLVQFVEAGGSVCRACHA